MASKFVPSVYATVFSTIPSLLVSIGAHAFIGYVMVDEHQKQIGEAAKAGAWAGGIVGFVGAIIGIVGLWLFPDVYARIAAETAASTPQVSEAMILQWTKIMSYVNLVLGPIFGALIAAGIAAFSGWITKKMGN